MSYNNYLGQLFVENMEPKFLNSAFSIIFHFPLLVCDLLTYFFNNGKIVNYPILFLPSKTLDFIEFPSTLEISVNRSSWFCVLSLSNFSFHNLTFHQYFGRYSSARSSIFNGVNFRATLIILLLPRAHHICQIH